MNFSSDLEAVKAEAAKLGLEWDDDLFTAAFGKGTYRWLISVMGVSYIAGMDIGLLDLHQNYNREDMNEQ